MAASTFSLILYSILLFQFVLIVCPIEQRYKETDEDNDFAEFEDFDEDEAVPVPPKEGVESSTKQSEYKDDGEKSSKIDIEENEGSELSDDDKSSTVEDDFENFDDPEEFENVDKTSSAAGSGSFGGAGEAGGQTTGGAAGGARSGAKLKIAEVPAHLRTSWESYYLEIILITGLVVYFANFLAGKTKNYKFAQTWLDTHIDLLNNQFHIVGDTGLGEQVQSGQLIKETESVYMFWCSGRVCVEGMLAELRFLKRQDIISIISNIFKPAHDQILIKVFMDRNEMDTFVFAISQKKTASKISKDMFDLSNFCQEKKGADKLGLPSDYTILAELGEVATSLIDSKMVKIFNDYKGWIDYIHISDQYSGAKAADESGGSGSGGSQQQSKTMPEPKKMIIFSFHVPKYGRTSTRDIEFMKPLLPMVFYLIDRVARFRLSKEGKMKAKKNRDRVLESYMKLSHQQRQEAAQQKREDKRIQEKEKMMNEEDPDKQRKWEKQQQKRDAKRRQPRMKMVKVQA